MHLRLDLQSFLPAFVLVKPARTNDLAQSYELCAGLRPGEIVVFDKAYVDFAHLYDLTRRGVQVAFELHPPGTSNPRAR